MLLPASIKINLLNCSSASYNDTGKPTSLLELATLS